VAVAERVLQRGIKAHLDQAERNGHEAPIAELLDDFRSQLVRFRRAIERGVHERNQERQIGRQRLQVALHHGSDEGAALARFFG
jgi:hypothetical protein